MTPPSDISASAALTELQTQQSEGVIDAYSPVSEWFGILMRTPSSGQAHIVQRGIGIDPLVYPIAGELLLAQPADGVIPELLNDVGNVLITPDLASRYSLTTSDELYIALANSGGEVQVVHIAGILLDTPDHTGSRLYYSLETAQMLHGSSQPFDYVVVAAEDVGATGIQFENAGWGVTSVDEQVTTPNESVQLFDFMLRGAGILGLMVGGIGIANTMHVLLAQRWEEIGVLKTLGYVRRDIAQIFIIEASMLGLVGSLLGVGFAVLISRALVEGFGSISTLLVRWYLDPLLVVSGLLIGLVTTVLFAGYAIFRASQVRPAVIFRRERIKALNWRSLSTVVVFCVLIAIPFTVVTSFILGSVIEGVGILLLALVGFIVIGLSLGGTTWVILRIMPVFDFHLLRMARNHMRKRVFSMLFAMIALFVGVFSLGFAMTSIQVSLNQFNARQVQDDGEHNILIYANSSQLPNIIDLLTAENALIDLRYHTPLTLADGTAIFARESAWDIEIVEGAGFGSVPNGVYVWEGSSQSLGSEVEIFLPNGTTQILPIVGQYTNHNSAFLARTFAPIVSIETVTSWEVDLSRVDVAVRVEPAREEILADRIGTTMPNTMILTRGDVLAESQQAFRNLFSFALALSTLALLAGIVLIANIVSLAMIDRLYEIGGMKAVGYTRKHVLVTLALEYGIVGTVTSILGIIGVQLVITIISLTQEGAEGLLWMAPTTALMLLLVGVSLTVLTAMIAAWESTRVRPLSVLNAR
ncbi:MAG: FtsX-like permease family protein [Chloroflexota bacterium]